MKIKKYYLILAVTTVILCVPALGEVKLPHPDKPELLGLTNPALVGIEQLHIVVLQGAELSEDDLIWKRLQTKVEERLIKADIRLAGMIKRGYAVGDLDSPKLKIAIDRLRLGSSQQYVFRVQTSLVINICLEKDPPLFLEIDVWTVGATVQPVSAQSEVAAVDNLVLTQVDAFIAAYLAANPFLGQSSDAAAVGAISPIPQKERTSPAARPAVAEYKYVASKNSKVFHMPDCIWAGRIKPKNLVGYSSRAEAIKAGKRPCKRCKP